MTTRDPRFNFDTMRGSGHEVVFQPPSDVFGETSPHAIIYYPNPGYVSVIKDRKIVVEFTFEQLVDKLIELFDPAAVLLVPVAWCSYDDLPMGDNGSCPGASLRGEFASGDTMDAACVLQDPPQYFHKVGDADV